MNKKRGQQTIMSKKTRQQTVTNKESGQSVIVKRKRKRNKPKRNASNKSAINFILKMEHLRKTLIPESVLTEYCIGQILVKERKYNNLFVFGAIDRPDDSGIS